MFVERITPFKKITAQSEHLSLYTAYHFSSKAVIDFCVLTPVWHEIIKLLIIVVIREGR